MMSLIARTWQTARGPSLTIFMYHAVIEEPLPLPDYCFIPEKPFASQMSWLAASGIRVMPLVDAVDAMSKGLLTGPTVAITFDDGYRNNVDFALPVLEQANLPATIFLATGLIGSEKALWPCRLNLAVEATKQGSVEWQGVRYELGDREARIRALGNLKEAVKLQSGDNPRRAVEEIERQLGVEVDPSVAPKSPYAMMDSNDIERAASSGLIDFGGHTVSHPIVSQLGDADLAWEIDQSLAATTELCGSRCHSFAYPNGGRADYDHRAMRLLKEHGVQAAVTTLEGTNRKGADHLQLRRIGVGPSMTPMRFSAAGNGLPVAALVDTYRSARRLLGRK